jgi:hypothetical protein
MTLSAPEHDNVLALSCREAGFCRMRVKTESPTRNVQYRSNYTWILDVRLLPPSRPPAHGHSGMHLNVFGAPATR